MHTALLVLSIVALSYFVLLNGTYMLFTLIAWRGLTRHRREQAYSALEETFASPLTPPISILLPAYNEEAGIVESVRSLLSLRYPLLEVVVVSDGSRDGTIDACETRSTSFPSARRYATASPRLPWSPATRRGSGRS
jgi:cellulose synthase/poly-beta-1,6-N-acetylglucosamine synthase-like glycosyltransferase